MKFAISVPIGAWHPILPDCLASLAAQGADLEVALLDASGDPRVRTLADEFADLLAYRQHAPDDGQADAIATGWANTTSDILGWLNADDILMPDALDKVQAAFARAEKPDVVYGHSMVFDEQKRFISYQWGVEPPSERLNSAAIISQPSCFFKRSSVDEIGGLRRDLHYTMDWDLFLRLYRAGAKFGFIDEVLSLILWGQETKTSSLNAARRAEIKAITDTFRTNEKPLRTMLGFGLQNIVDNAPPAFRQLLLRALIRGRRKIHGLAADGLIKGSASLEFCHYENELVDHLDIELSHSAAIEAVEVNGTPLDLEPTRTGLRVQPPEPLHAGTRINLSLRTKPGRSVIFRRVGWQ